ncbi:glycosyltransferase family 4 protein [Leeuwenhoekiella blandensis]|uniref:Glycosyl transferase family 1 domain-containing protein n=1 Tax=Leeuwenhoekiella blandensis (strain CECT 7118 / CCUG 51940 / KCTC 22103 / MED217) TaxID=398720 RepID=A3XR77_LEEBM|nr:glycosyltransferase family 4 protein [Leeuwenhoekiella blandensis]EAQ47942.1 hypothetical protein MED217_13661 [Leeuwenhoekiella blandensis MED217]
MKIICLHQSAELYGSDRSFLQVVTYFSEREDVTDILVLLPMHGPLVSELQKLKVQVEITRLCILRKVWIKKLQWGKLIFPLFKLPSKYKRFKQADIVYCNTTVVMDFYLLALVLKNRNILHVREIPDKWLTRFFTFFINAGKVLALYNSKSTAAAFKKVKRGQVVYNAFEGFNYAGVPVNEVEVAQPLKFLLVGRINDWKGQDFAVEAFSQLDAEQPFSLTILGSVFEGNEHLLAELKEKVQAYGLQDKVRFIAFVPDPEPYYQEADVLLVPSKKPEPFGRIAIEAMSIAKPVIAADHGGLSEIVIHKETGLLFTPNSQMDFIKCLQCYFKDRHLIREHGLQGYQRFKMQFSTQSLTTALDDVF